MAVAVASPDDGLAAENRRLRSQVRSLNDLYAASSNAHAHTLVLVDRLRKAMRAVAATEEAIRYERGEGGPIAVAAWMVTPEHMDELRAAADASSLPPPAVPAEWTAEALAAWETRVRAAFTPLLASGPRFPDGRGASDEVMVHLGQALERLDEPN